MPNSLSSQGIVTLAIASSQRTSHRVDWRAISSGRYAARQLVPEPGSPRLRAGADVLEKDATHDGEVENLDVAVPVLVVAGGCGRYG